MPMDTHSEATLTVACAAAGVNIDRHVSTVAGKQHHATSIMSAHHIYVICRAHDRTGVSGGANCSVLEIVISA